MPQEKSGKIKSRSSFTLKSPVSVVILCLNEIGTIRQCLEAVFSQKIDCKVEVIVIDSGSTDGSLDVVAEFDTKIIRILPNEFGHGKTRNLGAENASGEIIVFLNGDAIPHNKKWLSELVRPLVNSSNLAGIYSRQVPHPYHGGRIYRQLQRIYGAYPRLTTPLMSLSLRNTRFSTVSCALKKRIWKKAPFREDVWQAEDQFWAASIIRRGFSIAYNPASVVRHSHEESVKRLFRRAFELGFLSRQMARDYDLSPEIELIKDFFVGGVDKKESLARLHRLFWTLKDLEFKLIQGSGYLLGWMLGKNRRGFEGVRRQYGRLWAHKPAPRRKPPTVQLLAAKEAIKEESLTFLGARRHRLMKMLIIVGYVDLRHRIGCTPAFWQLFKGLYQLGHELIVIPYAGRDVETLWWSGSSNPAYWESWAFEKFRAKFPHREGSSRFNWSELVARQTVQRKWKKKIGHLLLNNRDIDVVVLINVPLTHVPSLGKYFDNFGIKTIFYDGDMPVHLPGFGGFSTGTNMFYEGCFEDYEQVITNSEGVNEYLKRLGARKTATLHWGADPEVFCPIDIPKRYDAFFYGFGTQFREKWIDAMICQPSVLMPDWNFLIGGRGFSRKGKEKLIGDVPFAKWHRIASASRINLNISRASHARIAATSAARPFELAAMKCCIVSNPHRGLGKWFENNKEIIIVKDPLEILEIYDWLLSDREEREQMGERAHTRLLKEHTYTHRAKAFVRFIS